MSFKWSHEQLEIFDEILNPTSDTLKIEATAGAAKSSSLVEAIARYKHHNPQATVRYMVFGNLAAKEAQLEFKHTAIVSTLHAYAYNHVVKPYGLGQVKPFLTWQDIPKTVARPFGKDSDIIELIENYCQSPYTSMDAYVDSIEDDSFQFNLIPAAKQILNLMATGRMPVTHSFYLKLFHILVMRGTEKLQPVDRLLIDEAQDMSAMALDIIERIPATQKVLVGDQNQRIFSFMKLVNGFERFPNGKVLKLSQSFRVDCKFAPAIQEFLRRHLDPTAVFEGMVYPDNVKPKTKAYLTRTNVALIAKMIQLNKAGIPYHLSHATKIKQMFKMPLAVIYAKAGKIEKDSELKHFQELVDNHAKIPLVNGEKIGLYTYLLNCDEADNLTKSAIKLVMTFSKEEIIEAYEQAESHKSQTCDLQLMTAHSSKGATRDIVELDEDMNEAIKEILTGKFKGTEEERRAELCLYFVAITRHRYQIINAKYLEQIMKEIK